MTSDARSVLAGGATADATAAYAARFTEAHPDAFAPLGRTGWTASRVGFGCYRVGWQNTEHGDALALALLAGVNVIDTSTNYMDGESEETVGAALAKLVAAGDLTREQVVVVSKAGYVQGKNLELVHERRKAGRPFTEVVEYTDGCWHCIHPEFLADQLARSLARLRLERLDCLLLHNPEYFLTDAAHRGARSEKSHDEYYRRIEAAFAWMEQQVAAGTIGCYGISSNTFVVPRGDFEHTSLARCVEIAERVGGGADRHHFRVAQMPGNLLETGFATESSQPEGRSPAAFAAAHGIAVLVNRPLNAFRRDGLVRLADVPAAAAVDESAILSAIDAMVAAEKQVHAVLTGKDELSTEARRLLRHGSFLKSHFASIDDREHWKQVVEMQLVPMAQYGLAAYRTLGTELNFTPEQRNLEVKYLGVLNLMLQRGFAWFAGDARDAAIENKQRVVDAAEEVGAPFDDEETLSQMAIRLLLCQAGAPCVLVGMRHHSYVRDVLGIFARPWSAPADPVAALRRVSAALGR